MATVNPELRQYVARVRNLMAEKADLELDIKAILEEAKRRHIGSTKKIKWLARIRVLDDLVEQRREEDEALAELGDFSTLPLGQAAERLAATPKRGPGRPRKPSTEMEEEGGEEHGDPLPLHEEATALH